MNHLTKNKISRLAFETVQLSLSGREPMRYLERHLRRSPSADERRYFRGCLRTERKGTSR